MRSQVTTWKDPYRKGAASTTLNNPACGHGNLRLVIRRTIATDNSVTSFETITDLLCDPYNKQLGSDANVSVLAGGKLAHLFKV